MPAPTDPLSVYRELADHYERLGQPAMRDRFLILAADAAMQARQPAVAEQLRQKLLQGSRHHMLRSYVSFAEASAAADVQTYLRDLRVNYPPEVAREMLEDMQPREAPGAKSLGPIPPTAPVMDVYAPQGQWQAQGPIETYPMAEEVSQPPAPAPAPPPKPLAQPLAGRAAPGRPAPRPQAPIPVTAPVMRAARPAPPPPAPASQPADEEGNLAGWFSAALGGVVLVVALAAAVFTLARPFVR